MKLVILWGRYSHVCLWCHPSAIGGNQKTGPRLFLQLRPLYSMAIFDTSMQMAESKILEGRSPMSETTQDFQGGLYFAERRLNECEL